MKSKQALIVFTAIVCITGLVIYALSLGHDGVMLMSAISVIAGLGGYTVATRRKTPLPPDNTLPQIKKGDSK